MQFKTENNDQFALRYYYVICSVLKVLYLVNREIWKQSNPKCIDMIYMLHIYLNQTQSHSNYIIPSGTQNERRARV